MLCVYLLDWLRFCEPHIKNSATCVRWPSVSHNMNLELGNWVKALVKRRGSKEGAKQGNEDDDCAE